MKYLYGVLVVVAVVAIAGGYIYPKIPSNFGASPGGSTAQNSLQFSVLGVNLAAPGTNATSSSVYNNTGQDLYITSINVGCEGVGTSKTAYTGAGLAALTLTAATSSTAAPARNTNSNTIGTTAMTIATTTAQFVNASSTVSGGSGGITNIWPAATYVSFFTNATNTAVCSFGVNALRS